MLPPTLSSVRRSHRKGACVRKTGRGEVAVFCLKNGGFGFEAMSKADVDRHTQKYSKTINAAS